MSDARLFVFHLYFCQNLTTLHRDLSVLADLLVLSLNVQIRVTI